MDFWSLREAQEALMAKRRKMLMWAIRDRAENIHSIPNTNITNWNLFWLVRFIPHKLLTILNITLAGSSVFSIKGFYFSKRNPWSFWWSKNAPEDTFWKLLPLTLDGDSSPPPTSQALKIHHRAMSKSSESFYWFILPQCGLVLTGLLCVWETVLNFLNKDPSHIIFHCMGNAHHFSPPQWG